MRTVLKCWMGSRLVARFAFSSPSMGKGGQPTASAALALVVILGAQNQSYAVSSDAILADTPPQQLSVYGFFEDMRAQKPVEGVVPFAINTPLFSDHALKFRFVHVPEGQAAGYDAKEVFDFPVGTTLIKTFAFPEDFRHPDENVRLIETRLLIRQENGWRAWAYLWNEEQTEAELKIAGAKRPVETVLADGSPLAFTYSVPNKNQCKGCHALDGEIAPIGPKARNLNGDFTYQGGSENQLAHWTASGILEGAPLPEKAPAVPDWRDETQPLDARARAWLDVNCAHCHRLEGPASNSGLFLTYGENDPVAIGVRKRPVAAGRGSADRPFDIAPGRPDDSILLYRVESSEPGVMMPELGRSLADRQAVNMLRAWITEMR